MLVGSIDCCCLAFDKVLKELGERCSAFDWYSKPVSGWHLGKNAGHVSAMASKRVS